jgi:hypothetical protein
MRHVIRRNGQRARGAEDRTSWAVRVALEELHNTNRAACLDGYRPICNAFWASVTIIGLPARPETRSLLSVARHADAAHVQLERARARIEALPPAGNAAGRAATHELIGEAELAIVALANSLDLATRISRREPHLAALPDIITRKRRRVRHLRDHYGRIDTRALELIRNNPDLDWEAAFRLDPLITSRTYSDGKRGLGIDGECSELLAATRSYLEQAWVALVSRETRSMPASR